MRINAERERIQRFKTIAKDSATCYYKIMDHFTTTLLDKQQMQKPIISDLMSQKEEEEEQEKQEEEPVKKPETKSKYDFKDVMNAAYKENQLHNTIRFMTDYLRQVIENGSRFTSGHFFIMLLQLSAKEVEN